MRCDLMLLTMMCATCVIGASAPIVTAEILPISEDRHVRAEAYGVSGPGDIEIIEADGFDPFDVAANAAHPDGGTGSAGQDSALGDIAMTAEGLATGSYLDRGTTGGDGRSVFLVAFELQQASEFKLTGSISGAGHYAFTGPGLDLSDPDPGDAEFGTSGFLEAGGPYIFTIIAETDAAIGIDTASFQFDFFLFLPPKSCYCAGDFNADGEVGAPDLAALLADWGSAGGQSGGCPTDIDGDLDVGASDLAILLAAWGSCWDCGAPDAGDCYEPNGTPSCDDATCCELVCEQDQFCCAVAWDELCADLAAALCNAGEPGACCIVGECVMLTGDECDGMGGQYSGDGIPCGPNTCLFNACTPDAGDCFVANGTPGCEQHECCKFVCTQDPFCCEVEWDQLCVKQAGESCDAP